MPRKRFAGKSMRAEKGVTVKTGVDVVFRKRTRGKRMVFGPIRAQKAEERAPAAQEASKTRQLSFDDYGPRGLAQRRIEDFKRYPAKKRRFRKEKSLEKKKAEEGEELIEAIREEMERPGAVRIRKAWWEKGSIPDKIKAKMQKEFPEAVEKLGKIKAAKKSEEVAAATYGRVFKEEEEVKKKEKKKMALVSVGTGDTKEMFQLVTFLIVLVLILAFIAWLASIF